ncbi:uncharacterized protein Dsimw501_GD27972 [Drosophila simulans]|nr:uncharacterized protein Dsimw501_GD27972 [Drosophila simulans]
MIYVSNMTIATWFSLICFLIGSRRAQRPRQSRYRCLRYV